MVEKVAWEVDGREIQREREGGRINSSKNLGGKIIQKQHCIFCVCIYTCMYAYMA